MRKWSKPIVVVLSPHRSGSSCVAGILHNLGWLMGKRLRKQNLNNPSGFFEPVRFCNKLRSMYKERLFLQKGGELSELKELWAPEGLRQKTMIKWMVEMQKLAAKKLCVGVGMKHPIMCLAVEDWLQAWGSDVKVILNERPLVDRVASLRCTGWSVDSAEHVQKVLDAERRRFIGSFEGDQHWVSFESLVKRPFEVIQGLVEFLELEPTAEQLDGAVNIVNPAQQRIGVTNAG